MTVKELRIELQKLEEQGFENIPIHREELDYCLDYKVDKNPWCFSVNQVLGMVIFRDEYDNH